MHRVLLTTDSSLAFIPSVVGNNGRAGRRGRKLFSLFKSLLCLGVATEGTPRRLRHPSSET